MWDSKTDLGHYPGLRPQLSGGNSPKNHGAVCVNVFPRNFRLAGVINSGRNAPNQFYCPSKLALMSGPVIELPTMKYILLYKG